MDVKQKLRKLLREAMAHGWSVYRISKETDVDQAALQRFVTDPERDLSLTSSERLLEFFNVDLTDGKIPDAPDET